MFHSLYFATGCSVLLLLYWLARQHRQMQNILLLLASVVFYSYSFYAQHAHISVIISFLGYLATVTVFSYAFAMGIAKAQSNHLKSALTYLAVGFLGFGLFYVKYFGFTLHILHSIFTNLFITRNFMRAVAPLGISFYSLSAIGYVLDVKKGRIAPERNLLTFAAYISFFPHLLSGPIPSAKEHLHQFAEPSTINLDKIIESFEEIVWGLFKKMVIADNISIAVNYCFKNHEHLNGSTLYIALTLFSFQIYADFSGYSDMARGIARLLGFEIYRNFNLPFFSTSPAEFWRRWHTSLRQWLLTYLYIPLGGNKGPLLQRIGVIFLLFSLSGIWHGAHYTFLIWGLVNGAFFLPQLIRQGGSKKTTVAPVTHAFFPKLWQIPAIVLTFSLINLSRVFFRSPNIQVALDILSSVFSASILQPPSAFIAQYLYYCLPLAVAELILRNRDYIIAKLKGSITYQPKYKKWVVFVKVISYVILLLLIYLFCKKHDSNEYYYFRF